MPTPPFIALAGLGGNIKIFILCLVKKYLGFGISKTVIKSIGEHHDLRIQNFRYVAGLCDQGGFKFHFHLGKLECFPYCRSIGNNAS